MTDTPANEGQAADEQTAEGQATEKQARGGSRFSSMPATKVGWWAVGLMVAFVVLFAINAAVFMRLTSETWWQRNILPFYGILMLGCGLAAGITSLVAIIRKHERSWLLWLPLLPAAFVVFFVVGEFAFPH